MATSQPQQPKLDRYIVIHVATTCDEHGVYVTKDSAETIEIGWICLDAKSCEEVSIAQLIPSSRQYADSCVKLHRQNVLVKPVNTPITPLCSKFPYASAASYQRRRLGLT